MNINKKRVIIVGGGFGGIEAAKRLDSKFQVIVIERNNLFFNCLASVRLLLEPELLDKFYIPYDKVLKNGKFIFSTVVNITEKQVLLNDGQELEFDYLIIATGSNTLAPFKSPLELFGKKEETKQYFNNLNQQIKDANHILIVGGGSVAMELIGEIYDYYPLKKITTIHSGSKLCNNSMSDKFNFKILESMKIRNVNLILNDRLPIPNEIRNVHLKNQSSPIIELTENKDYTTEKGTLIKDVNLVLYTVGIKNNNESFLKSFSNQINEQGQLIVNNNCQVKGFNNIFAIGDITNFSELKTAYNARYHAIVTSKCIEILSNNDSSNIIPLPSHIPSKSSSIALSLGKNDGLLQLPNGWVIDWSFLTKLFKSKHLYIPQLIKMLNNPKPFNFN